MSAPIFRLTKPGDESELRTIWSAAYDGDTACAELYFSQCYRPGDGVAAELDGKLCSAIYLMEGVILTGFAGRDQSAVYLYALGTPEQYRGLGLGGRTIWRSGVEGYLRGCDEVCFLPASQSLSQWYGDILGTKVCFFRRTGTVVAGDPPQAGRVAELDAERYNELREQLLTGHPHAKLPGEMVELQRQFCTLYGGGLYELELDGKTAICACDREGEAFTLRELLCPGLDPADCARLLLAEGKGRSAEVRTPAFWHEGFGAVSGDCVWIPGGQRFPKSEEPPFWGIALD